MTDESHSDRLDDLNLDDDGAEQPEIYALKRDRSGWRLSRRDFLGGTAAAAAGALTGAAPAEAKSTTSNKWAYDRIQAFKSGVIGLSFTNDNRQIIAASKTYVKKWSMPEGALLDTHGSYGQGVAICPAAGKVFSLKGLTRIVSYDLADLKSKDDRAFPKELLGGSFIVKKYAVSPDGTVMALATDKKEIHLVDLVRYQRIALFKGHSEEIEMLALSPDNRWLASIGRYGARKIWGLSRFELEWTPVSPKHKIVTAMSFSPDSRWLVIGNIGGEVEIYSLAERDTHKILKTSGRSITALAITPDGRNLIATGRKSNIKILDRATGKSAASLNTRGKTLSSLDVSPDGSLLAAGSDDGVIWIWSLKDRKFKTALLDLDATPKQAKGIKFQTKNQAGQVITRTLPCGSPIPPGAVCTCNCVPGSYVSPSPPKSAPRRGTGTICTCDKVHYWYPN